MPVFQSCSHDYHERKNVLFTSAIVAIGQWQLNSSYVRKEKWTTGDNLIRTENDDVLGRCLTSCRWGCVCCSAAWGQLLTGSDFVFAMSVPTVLWFADMIEMWRTTMDRILCLWRTGMNIEERLRHSSRYPISTIAKPFFTPIRASYSVCVRFLSIMVSRCDGSEKKSLSFDRWCVLLYDITHTWGLSFIAWLGCIS